MLLKFKTYFFVIIVLIACEPKYEGEIVPPIDARPSTDNLFLSTDYTTFQSMNFEGIKTVNMYNNGFKDLEAYVFTAIHENSKNITMVLEKSLASDQTVAEEILSIYAREYGKIPFFLRTSVENIHVVNGSSSWWGSKPTITAGRYSFWESYYAVVFMHEAAHVSLGTQNSSEEYKQAQQLDYNFISPYTASSPKSEDIAESIIFWFAYRFRPERLEESVKQRIESTIYHRMEFFDQQNFDVSPVE